MRYWLPLSCVLLVAQSATADAPAWPPPLDSLSNGEACAERPACDMDAPNDEISAAFGAEGRFVRVLDTTASDCPRLVAVTDPRAKLGNVATEPFEVRFQGSCVLSGEGAVIGAVRSGVMATCQETQQAFGAVALETAIIDFASEGKGRAHVPVFGLPWLLVGQSACEIALDVQIRARQTAPEDSPGPQSAE